jgi:hypothetical protein
VRQGKKLAYLPYKTVLRLKHYGLYDVGIMIWLISTACSERKRCGIPMDKSWVKIYG